MIRPITRRSFALSLGLVASILVFFMNLMTNLYSTSLIRGIIAFIIFYLLGSIIHLIIITNAPKSKGSSHQVKLDSDADLDMNEIYQTARVDGKMNQNKDSVVEFQPLELKKIELSD